MILHVKAWLQKFKFKFLINAGDMIGIACIFIIHVEFMVTVC